MKRLITLFTLMVMFAIGMQAQIVGANEGPKTKMSNTTSSLYKPTGHYLRLEAGYAHIFSVAYGYQINPYIMIGGGVGFGYLHNPTLPIYAEAIFSTPRYKWSFIGDIKIGIDPIGSQSFFIDPRIGISYKNFGLAIGGAISWTLVPDISIYYNIPLRANR